MQNEEFDYDGTTSATYCPEDDKLRLYCGRVPREEYLRLKAEGWQALHKQRETGGGDFAATWTVERENTALMYGGGVIDDEDKSPQERAADRAERFGGYRDKRLDEAGDKADAYEAGPALHGHQSLALAERRAARHDRLGTSAVVLWDKAEYWHARTAGVIAHALHKSSPGVRMGRIKVIEAEIRKLEAGDAEYRKERGAWEAVRRTADPQKAYDLALNLANCVSHGHDYRHPRPEEARPYYRDNDTSLYSLLTSEEGSKITGHEAAELWFAKHPKDPDDPTSWRNRTLNHARLRLAYENQMLEAQGGRAAHVEMEPGGWIGGKQIMKVNKSPATGRVVSVGLRVPQVQGWVYQTVNVPGTDYAIATLKVERLPAHVYRPPTDEERDAFAKMRKNDKKQKAETGPKEPPIINLTDEDAERLQAVWNEARKGKRSFYDDAEPRKVIRTTQERYSATSKGSYGAAGTEYIVGGGRIRKRYNTKIYEDFPAVARIRAYHDHVVVLTDKPQKPLPAEAWIDPTQACRDRVIADIGTLKSALSHSWVDHMTPEERKVYLEACVCGLAYYDSQSQFGWTDAGRAVIGVTEGPR